MFLHLSMVVSVRAVRRCRQTVNTHTVLILCLKAPFHKLIALHLESRKAEVKGQHATYQPCGLKALAIPPADLFLHLCSGHTILIPRRASQRG